MTTTEKKMIGIMGAGGYASVTRAGEVFRVYHGRNPDDAVLWYTSTDDAIACRKASELAFTRKGKTLDYLEAVR